MTDGDTAVGRLKYWSGDWKIDSLPIHLSDLGEPYQRFIKIGEGHEECTAECHEYCMGKEQMAYNMARNRAERWKAKATELEVRLAKAEDAFNEIEALLDSHQYAEDAVDPIFASIRKAREAMK